MGLDSLVCAKESWGVTCWSSSKGHGFRCIIGRHKQTVGPPKSMAGSVTYVNVQADSACLAKEPMFLQCQKRWCPASTLK